MKQEFLIAAQEFAEEYRKRANKDKTTLFIGDSFFDKRYFWTDFEEVFAGKDAFCAGISSTTTYEWEEFFPKYFTKIPPKNLVVNLGTNNFYDVFDSAQTFRLIQLPDWTMVDLSTDLKTAYESGNGIYVVWGYNAESGGMDIYAGTTKENVAKVGSFRADAFPKNGTVSAVGFGDGLWGNPDFSVTVELNYGATLNEALGLTESE